jgi:hypothetical protein
MGKRELLLVVGFLIVGVVVYQATAPPPGPNERSFSLSAILNHVRREMRGSRANAQDTKVSTHELEAGTKEIQISGSFAELTVTGEDRKDVEIKHRVTSTGYDDAEARTLVHQTMEMLKVDRAGVALRLNAEYPGPGSQRAFLTMLVPSNLSVRVDQGAPRSQITNVAAVEMTVRGEITLKKIAGKATVTHRAGRLIIDDVAALKLTGRGSDASVTAVKGDASFSMQSGELTATSIRGPIDVESQGADITFRKLEEAQGPMRINATSGSVTLEGLKGDARVDGRGTEIDVAMSKAASVAIYNEGDEPIELTVPPGGFVLDARVTRARLSLPDDLRDQITVTESGGDDKEQRANGSVGGGGPTVTLRANRGDIVVRGRAAAPKPER